MNREHKLFAIYLLKRLALSDQTFQMSEQDYVDKAGLQLGLSHEEISNITLDAYTIKTMPAREQDRMTILYYLLFFLKADGVLLQEERAEIRKIGFELGFRDEQILKMVEVVEKNKGHQFNPEELIEIIRIVLN